MEDPRSQLSRARRIVVKIGSRALFTASDTERRIAADVAALVKSDRKVVVVSSGAIAIGIGRLGMAQRPTEMAKLQAAAAAGQSVLMRRWDEAFEALDVTSAQVLLTHADLSDRTRLNNARQALAELLDAGAVPIVNENDTVATEEIAFGDNDQLASMVVPLVGAELLVLLTDVDGVLDEQGERLTVASDTSRVVELSPDESVGRGGMKSKLAAARKASVSGANVVIANAATERVLARIVAGEDLGTIVPATGTVLRARKHWIAFTLKPRGTVVVDAGAARALSEGKSSLLPVGVVGVRGDFHAGDSVRLESVEGHDLGCGLARYGALDVARAAGRKGADLVDVLGKDGAEAVVVHKDDLVGAV